MKRQNLVNLRHVFVSLLRMVNGSQQLQQRGTGGVTYRWEQGVKAALDSVQEDEAGRLITAGPSSRDRQYRLSKHNRITTAIRRGLIRYLLIAIDCSKASAETDYKPCRLQVSKSCVKKFITEYFDQNPISQVSLAVTRDRVAQKITDLSGNPRSQIHKLDSILNMTGLASLQNTITLGISMLKHIPNYGHREVLVLFSSLSTCDPGDIFSTIKDAIALKIRISVICLAAEVFVCKQIADLTGGSFSVALDATHLSELLALHTFPPPEVQQRKEPLVTDFIYMGFPKRTFDTGCGLFGFEGKRMKLSATAYICPRCSTRTTDVPTQCCVCSLQLNSSSHIARSHHHLFPLPNFTEHVVKRIEDPSSDVRGTTAQATYQAVPVEASAVEVDRATASSIDPSVGAPLSQQTGRHRCRGCLQNLLVPGLAVSSCPLCTSFFCLDCDLFIHDSLHNCPGC